MAQLALYRTWRPQSFGDVVGQEQTIQTLKNAVQQGRVSHAYLFCGPRGTGKTSVAKILAKAVNCLEPAPEGEPCNHCLSCREINGGGFMDVIEIDAASNRGIDEIRDLKEKVRMVPAQGKTKVYIIDEVHMLTTEAFNALLKTLEEPPRSVIFILATTEPHRIPATILSRCQRYNFRRLTRTEIVDRLQLVTTDKGVKVEEEALALIASQAAGSLRDGLSLLDQCLAFRPTMITRDDVLDILGLVDDRFLCNLFGQVLNGDVGGVITSINQVLAQGKEAQQFAREASMYLRDMLVVKTVGKHDLNLVTEETQDELIQQAERVEVYTLLSALKKMMELTGELRFSDSPRFVTEVNILELISILRAGQGLSGLETPGLSPPVGSRVDSGAGDTSPVYREEVPWRKVLEKVKVRKVTTHALLAEARCIGIKNDLVLIGFRKGFKFHREKMGEKENRTILLEALEEMLKRKVNVEFVMLGDAPENDPLVQKAIEIFGEDLIKITD